MNEPDDSVDLNGIPATNRTGWAYRDLNNTPREWTPTVKPRSVTASANVNALDDEIRADCTAGVVTMTLETAVGCDGRMHTFKKIDASANALTVATTASQTIDGAATLSLSTRYDAATVISNGTNWDIKSKAGASSAAGGAANAWGLITPATTVTVAFPTSGVSVTNPGTGNYVVTHGVTFSSTNYSVLITPVKSGDISIFSINSRTATTFNVTFYDSAFSQTAPTAFSYACFGNV